MTDNQHQIKELFTMFHDFEIVSLTHSNITLTLTVLIPWGQLWNDLDYRIKVNLFGCNFLSCDYAEIINTPDNLAKNSNNRSSVDKLTNDPKIISQLGLEIQSYKFYSPNKYEFLCNSSRNCAGGKLTFTADNYSILNESGNQIELDQMKTWSAKWWDNIKNKEE